MRNVKIFLVRAKRCYTFREIADLLKVHIRTVQGWHKEGLRVVEGSHPYFVEGSVLRVFLAKRRDKNKVRLQPGETFCLSCKQAVVPANLAVIRQGKRIGLDRQMVTLKGTCPRCGKAVFRFSSEPVSPTVVQTPVERLKGQDRPA